MGDYTLSDENTDKALDKLLERLVANKVIHPNEVPALKETMGKLLKEQYPDGNVPQDLFTDPKKLGQLVTVIVSASVQSKVNDPKMKQALDPKKLFDAFFKPDDPQAKNTITSFCTTVNQLRPTPKRLTQEELEKAINERILAHEQEKKADNNPASDKNLAEQLVDDLAELNFEILYGMTESGQQVVLGSQQGNAGGNIDQSVAYSGLGGNARSSRGFEDLASDPTMHVIAEVRMLDLGGLSDGFRKQLHDDHITYEPPGLKMGPASAK